MFLKPLFLVARLWTVNFQLLGHLLYRLGLVSDTVTCDMILDT